MIDYLTATLSQPKPSHGVTTNQDEEETKKDIYDQADEFSMPSEGDQEFVLDDNAISQNSNLIDDMIANQPKRSVGAATNLQDRLGIKYDDGEGSAKNKLAFYPSPHMTRTCSAPYLLEDFLPFRPWRGVKTFRLTPMSNSCRRQRRSSPYTVKNME